jgi:hypothetical protein
VLFEEFAAMREIQEKRLVPLTAERLRRLERAAQTRERFANLDRTGFRGGLLA